MQLTYDELKYLHEVILFQNLIDHKNRRIRDRIHNEIIGEMERLEKQEVIKNEDKEDAKHRRKIVK
jgi:hypothetical protein